MADSPSLRNKRSRLHQAGDHSFCVPGRCEFATPVVTETVTAVPPSPPKLGEAGSRLWTALSPGLNAMHLALLVEACRIADRLDKLDSVLRGDAHEWLELTSADPSGRIAVVIVDKALGEARQQAVALKGIVAELRQAGAGAAKKPTLVKRQGGAGGSVSDLAARIAARRGSSAG